MSQLWKEKESVLRAQAKADTGQSAREIRNGRDAATPDPTSSVRRKSQQPQDEYAVKPPAGEGIHRNVPRNLGHSNDTDLPEDVRQLIENRVFEHLFEQDIPSLWNVVHHSNVPHPLVHYSARGSLVPNSTSNQSTFGMFMHTICRHQGLLLSGAIKTPSGRLLLVPRGKTWADKYDKEIRNCLKRLTSQRAKNCPRSGGTIKIVWSRWTAIKMARSYAVWFSCTEWWQGAIGAATFKGRAISDWMHLLSVLDDLRRDNPAEIQEAYDELTGILGESRVLPNSKLFGAPVEMSPVYQKLAELQEHESGQLVVYAKPEEPMSDGALALAITKLLMVLENHDTESFGTLAEGRIWFDIQEFRGGYIDKNGKRRNRNGRRFTFNQNEKRRKKQKSPDTNGQTRLLENPPQIPDIPCKELQSQEAGQPPEESCTLSNTENSRLPKHPASRSSPLCQIDESLLVSSLRFRMWDQSPPGIEYTHPRRSIPQTN
ncbi:uncharacterized protein PAC_08948 [Phialocephala subalpina]|uniref:Uncharacterized protein n=1 Tax=Phialocephala subalpina TaxID=576137 RepID=A0A1L7X200_9HELO|nr:uncharacterized protein PAC_08948 [Phialocephala subalpina]